MNGIPIVVPVRFATRGLSLQTTSGWLSLDAVFVRCPEAPSKGTSVALRVSLPGQAVPERIEGMAGERVPRGADGEVGFWARFCELPIASRRRIERFLLGRDAAISSLSRRAFPRVPLRREVLVRVRSNSFIAHVQNVSRGGMFVAAPGPASLHELWDVELNLPAAAGTVRTKAEVVQRMSPVEAKDGRVGVGLQFVGADDAFRDRLDNCLDDLLAAPLMAG